MAFAPQWPKPDGFDGDFDNPFDLVNRFKDHYMSVCRYTADNPTATAPASYVLDLIFQANKVVTVLANNLSSLAIRQNEGVVQVPVTLHSVSPHSAVQDRPAVKREVSVSAPEPRAVVDGDGDDAVGSVAHNVMDNDWGGEDSEDDVDWEDGSSSDEDSEDDYYEYGEFGSDDEEAEEEEEEEEDGDDDKGSEDECSCAACNWTPTPEPAETSERPFVRIGWSNDQSPCRFRSSRHIGDSVKHALQNSGRPGVAAVEPQALRVHYRSGDLDLYVLTDADKGQLTYHSHSWLPYIEQGCFARIKAPNPKDARASTPPPTGETHGGDSSREMANARSGLDEGVFSSRAQQQRQSERNQRRRERRQRQKMRRRQQQQSQMRIMTWLAYVAA